MLFLTPRESMQWRMVGEEVLQKGGGTAPRDPPAGTRESLRPIFNYYIGALLAAKGNEAPAGEWFATGAQVEDENLMSNAFTSAFLKRQKGRFIMPAVVFADPRPYLHAASVPMIRKARESFLCHSAHSLPKFTHPVKMVDLGCGDGGLTVAFLRRLREAGRIGDLSEVLLVDSSPAMAELALRTVGDAFPATNVRAVNRKIQELSDEISHRYDIALSSLAYHHMPYEKKLTRLKGFAEWVDHFLVFEIDANNDTPELYSPELACSVYQTYGRIIDFVFSHDAPVEVAQNSVDCFLMTEMVSLLTQPRGVRNDYHMLRRQWHTLFTQGLGGDFCCLCDSTCLSDEYLDIFTMHYGK